MLESGTKPEFDQLPKRLSYSMGDPDCAQYRPLSDHNRSARPGSFERTSRGAGSSCIMQSYQKEESQTGRIFVFVSRHFYRSQLTGRLKPRHRRPLKRKLLIFLVTSFARFPASIIWSSPEAMSWIRSSSRNHQGELAVRVTLEKEAIKQSDTRDFGVKADHDGENNVSDNFVANLEATNEEVEANPRDDEEGENVDFDGVEAESNQGENIGVNLSESDDDVAVNTGQASTSTPRPVPINAEGECNKIWQF
nr:DNA-directed RNA polymerase V subunit 1 [Ipomoea batatas]